MNAFAKALLDSRRAAAAVGPKTRWPWLGEAIGKPQAQRQLRSHDDEIDLFPLDDVNEIIRAGQIRVNETGNRLDARISWRAEDFPDVAFGSKPAREGMLARAGTDDQNSHRVNNLEAKMGLHGAGPAAGSISLT